MSDKAAPARRDPPSLHDMFSSIPNIIKTADVAVAALLSVTVASILVPDQLGFLRAASAPLALLAILITWVSSRGLEKRLVAAASAATVLLVGLLVMIQLYVVDVPYRTGTRHFLVGTQLSERGAEVARRLGNADRGTVIFESGPGAIAQLWDNYHTVAVSYIILFTAFVVTASLALGLAVHRTLLTRPGPAQESIAHEATAGQPNTSESAASQ